MMSRDPLNPGERKTLTCMTCKTKYERVTEQEARCAGWRVWSGETLGGKPQRAVFCPACCGETGTTDEGEPAGFDAWCRTCDAYAADEWSDEAPLSHDDVKEWERDHRCDPDVEIQPPTKRAEAVPV